MLNSTKSLIVVIGFSLIGLLFFYDLLFEPSEQPIILEQNPVASLVHTEDNPPTETELALAKLLRGSGLNLTEIPQVFAPGTLTIPAVEVMRQCYFPPEEWRQHRGKYQCVISDEAKLYYYHVPKSGSSTNRRAFRGRFNGEDGSTYCQGSQSEERLSYRSFTAVREPLDRFYSQWMEAEWRASRGEDHQLRKVVASSGQELWKIENEEERFMKYVDYWHETGEFSKMLRDTHLRLQAAMFTWLDGSIRPLDWVVKMETINKDWRALSNFFGKDWEDLEMARKNPNRALNDTIVGDLTKQKICQIVAMDYCCLNYELPEVCKGVVWCTFKARLPLRDDALRTIQTVLPDLDKISFDPPEN